MTAAAMMMPAFGAASRRRVAGAIVSALAIALAIVALSRTATEHHVATRLAAAVPAPSERARARTHRHRRERSGRGSAQPPPRTGSASAGGCAEGGGEAASPSLGDDRSAQESLLAALAALAHARSADVSAHAHAPSSAAAAGEGSPALGARATAAECTPLNTERFACTPDGESPARTSVSGHTAYTPCCPGSAARYQGLWRGHRCTADALPAESGGETSAGSRAYTLECVSTAVVPPCRRCDLTSTAGASSCPLARMQRGRRYLLYPGGSTACIFAPTLTGVGECAGRAGRESTRYSFDVVRGAPPRAGRRAAGARLLIYFQGGGACWDHGTTTGPFGGVLPLNGSLCSTLAAPELGGILGPAGAENRFGEYTVVQVRCGAAVAPPAHHPATRKPEAARVRPAQSPAAPRLARRALTRGPRPPRVRTQVHYCSGDVHAANLTRPYHSAGWPHTPATQRGYDNTLAVLRWIEAQPELSALDDLVLAGGSAGSVGAQVWAAHVLRTLGSRAARTAAVFDSFLGIFPEGSGVLGTFSASGAVLQHSFGVCGLALLLSRGQRAACERGALSLRAISADTIAAFPDTQFLFVQSKQDTVQRLFYDAMYASYWEHLGAPRRARSTGRARRCAPAAAARARGAFARRRADAIGRARHARRWCASACPCAASRSDDRRRARRHAEHVRARVVLQREPALCRCVHARGRSGRAQARRRRRGQRALRAGERRLPRVQRGRQVVQRDEQGPAWRERAVPHRVRRVPQAGARAGALARGRAARAVRRAPWPVRRAMRVPTTLPAAAQVGVEEMALFRAGKCCAHPGQQAILAGPEPRADLPLAEWAAVPLVRARDAAPDAVPPRVASMADTCYGPEEAPIDVHPPPSSASAAARSLYACPAYLAY